MVLKLLPQKSVEDGADAAVQVGKVSCDVHRIVEGVWAIVLLSIGHLDGFQQDDHVVRRPADEEGEDDDKDEFDRSALLRQASGHDPNGYADVAVQDDTQKHQEEKEKLLIITNQLPFCEEFLVVTGHFAQQSVSSFHHIIKNDILYTSQNTEHPDSGGWCNRISHPPALGCRDGVDHRKVAVEGHDGEEEDGAVEADGITASHQLAKASAKDPFRFVVDCPEREAGGEDEVRNDEVEQEYVGNRSELLIFVDNAQHQSISNQAQQEVNVVEGWEKCCSELEHIAFLA